eukprot:4793999-Amphidinium_carterae.1
MVEWDIVPGTKEGEFPLPTEDFRMRLSSAPAGAAAWTVTLAALTQLFRSVYCKVIGQSIDFTPFRAGLEVIARAPWKCHVGAGYLASGLPGGALINRVERVPEDILALASAFVHAVKGGSTLAKSPNLMPKSEVSSDANFMAFNTLAVSLAKSKVDVQKIVDEMVQKGNVLMFNEEMANFINGLPDKMTTEEARYSNLAGLKIITGQSALEGDKSRALIARIGYAP